MSWARRERSVGTKSGRRRTKFSAAESVIGYVDALEDVPAFFASLSDTPRFRNNVVVDFDVDEENDAADVAVAAGSNLEVFAVARASARRIIARAPARRGSSRPADRRPRASGARGSSRENR